MSRTYDDHFRVHELKVNGATAVGYVYDQDNLLLAAGPMTIARRADNGVMTGTAIGALTTTQSVTTFGDVNGQSASYGSDVYFAEEFTTRDQQARIRGLTQTISTGSGSVQTKAYGYDFDAVGRLTDTFQDALLSAHYDYDANGNRTAYMSSAGTVVGKYDNQDRLTRYCPEDALGNALPTAGLPCNAYAYAASGELALKVDVLGAGVTTYDYDEFGGLRHVQLPSGSQVDYETDPSGRRVGKSVDGIKQWGLLYAGGLRPVAQLDSSNQVTATFGYATKGNVPDYMVRSGHSYRFITDHIGSVRMMVDTSDGSVAQRIDYDEFGNVLLDTNPGFQPFGFAGGLYDADTGIVRFGARDYDAVTGRWMAKDPILFAGGQVNLYAYVGNEPVNRIDPRGLLTGQIGIGVMFGGVSIPGVTGAPVGAFGFQAAIATDDDGNWAILGTGKVGVGTESGVGVEGTMTNADTVFDLEGFSETGGVAIGPFSGEVVGGSGYGGASWGLGFGEPGFHALLEYSKILRTLYDTRGTKWRSVESSPCPKKR